MFRPAIVVALRPIAQLARCLHFALKSGLATQIADAPIRTQCRHFRLSSHDSILSSSKESIAEPDERSESLKINQYMSTLSPEEREEYATIELQKLSPHDEKRLQTLEMEYDVWMSTGKPVPEEMTQSMWFQLLHSHSQYSRSKLYSFWKKRLQSIRNKVHRREARQQRRVEKRARLEQLGRKMGLPHGTVPLPNSIHMFITGQMMRKQQYNNLAWAMQFGQPFVIDLDFEVHMHNRERTSLLKQLRSAYSANKNHPEPFNLVMCGLTEDGLVDRRMKRELSMADVPMTITSQSYLDLYPHEQLVYLTPDSPNELVSWSPHDIYIIGALVDLGPKKTLTLDKAESQNLRTACLPIDRFMLWKQGRKSLTLYHMLAILGDIKEDGDWCNALRHISDKNGIVRPQARELSQNNV